jgi:hypothetical protein
MQFMCPCKVGRDKGRRVANVGQERGGKRWTWRTLVGGKGQKPETSASTLPCKQTHSKCRFFVHYRTLCYRMVYTDKLLIPTGRVAFCDRISTEACKTVSSDCSNLVDVIIASKITLSQPHVHVQRRAKHSFENALEHAEGLRTTKHVRMAGGVTVPHPLNLSPSFLPFSSFFPAISTLAFSLHNSLHLEYPPRPIRVDSFKLLVSGYMLFPSYSGVGYRPKGGRAQWL